MELETVNKLYLELSQLSPPQRRRENLRLFLRCAALGRHWLIIPGTATK